MCSETAPPRFSFSHDDLSEDVPHKDTLLDLESNPEFEFSTSTSLEFESSYSSADELFSNGVMLPMQTQERNTTRKHTRYGEPPYMRLPPRPCTPTVDRMKKKSIREVLDVNAVYEKKSTQSMPLWGFSRSKSLNCDTNKSLICSSPPLSRSNSSGSALNPKRMSSNKQPSAANASLYPMQKSPSGKSYGGSYANGLRISPVLNVPTPYISKGSASLFGLGSFLRVGKAKKSKN